MDVTPRFSVGTKVECNMGDAGWCKGSVVEVWHRSEGWKGRRTAFYNVNLDGGSSCTAPLDTDSCIRLVGWNGMEWSGMEWSGIK